MAIRAVVIEDLEDDEVTVAVSVSDGKVRLINQSEEEGPVTSVVLDIRDISSAINFLDSADSAPDLAELRETIKNGIAEPLPQGIGNPQPGPFAPGGLITNGS
jgi:hypothetical protein